MKHAIIFLLSICTWLFSLAGANHIGKPAGNRNLFSIAFKLAADPGYREAIKQTVNFHQQLLQNIAVEDIKILQNSNASGAEWNFFLVKMGFSDKQSFFRHTDRILETYKNLFGKYLRLLNYNEKKEVIELAARIFSWKLALKNRSRDFDCMSAYMAASSFCVALWDLQSAQGNPQAAANFAFCMSSNATLYQLCALIIN